MRYRLLGQTGLKVSVICQGTWSIATRDAFWDGQDRADSMAAIHSSLDAGVNFFDTAPLYGNGESEEILGEALGSRRGEVILATKVAPTELEPAGCAKVASAACGRCAPKSSTSTKSIGPTIRFPWNQPWQPWRPCVRKGKSATLACPILE